MAQESLKILAAHENHACPDCGEQIPPTVSNGDKCKGCGYIFYEVNVSLFGEGKCPACGSELQDDVCQNINCDS